MEGVPAVEMLWESADPDRELTARFGFRDVARAAAWITAVLDRCWQLEVVRCERLVISGRNVVAWIHAGDGPLIVKWSALPKRFSRLADSARLVAWLDTQGLPVAAPIAASDADLAKAAVLLATRYRDWGPTSERVRAEFLRAYDDQAHEPLDTAERREIERHVAALLKHFGWTETGRPPAEPAAPNGPASMPP